MNIYAPIRLLAVLGVLAVLSACAGNQSADAVATSAREASAAPVGATLEFEGVDLGFRAATAQVEQAGTYSVTFTNTGSIDHDWVVGDTRLLAKPGQTVSGEVVVPVEGLEFVCSFPGHAAAGMRGTITVESQTSKVQGHEND